MKQGKYDKLMAVLQTGDCLIIRNNDESIVSDGIEWFSDGHVSHIAMYLERDRIAEFCAEGATISKVGRYCEDHYQVWVRRIKDINEPQMNMMKNAGYLSVFDHQKYGFVFYLGFIIYCLIKKAIGFAPFGNNPFGNSKQEVCSTGYVKWARVAGIDLAKGQTDLTTPQDLFVSPMLKTVGEA